MIPEASRHNVRIAISFAMVYVVWGSTYLAMRVAVRHIPPYAVGSVRYMASGPLMLAFLAVSGRKVRPSGRDLACLAVIGGLLLSVSNVGVMWAEEYLPSGMTALIVALVPIFVAALEAWAFDAGRLPVRGLAGLALGIGGTAVLLWPKIISGSRMGRLELMGAGILAGVSLSWALGSILSHRWTLSVDVFTAAAWQMTLAGLMNTTIALAWHKFQRAQWTPQGFGAIAYLVVFGSWIGFTAYIWLLEHVPPPKVATYAYVNPIVAVFLGWLLLHEKVDAYMLAGTVIIIAAVALVNTSKLKREAQSAAREAVDTPVVTASGD